MTEIEMEIPDEHLNYTLVRKEFSPPTWATVISWIFLALLCFGSFFATSFAVTSQSWRWVPESGSAYGLIQLSVCHKSNTTIVKSNETICEVGAVWNPRLHITCHNLTPEAQQNLFSRRVAASLTAFSLLALGMLLNGCGMYSLVKHKVGRFHNKLPQFAACSALMGIVANAMYYAIGAWEYKLAEERIVIGEFGIAFWTIGCVNSVVLMMAMIANCLRPRAQQNHPGFV
eukprot:TRINITY_DN68127_c7_g10_i1.p1 TRINITY_DN68127_c7_g10~~TRINITY_DN68127_c7_g10_i1.p1  ORF type:complete len:230 (+),score=2.17 TRINITY_DN68127_c7_g10_i1:111-800(+)